MSNKHHRTITGLSKGRQRAVSQCFYRVVKKPSKSQHRVTQGSHIVCIPNYLAPLKREINERNDVILKAMRPGTISDGMNTDDDEIILNIILGIKVCKK